MVAVTIVHGGPWFLPYENVFPVGNFLSLVCKEVAVCVTQNPFTLHDGEICKRLAMPKCFLSAVFKREIASLRILETDIGQLL